MKNIIIVLGLLGAVACNSSQQDKNKNETIRPDALPSTAYINTFNPSSLPPLFAMDEISVEDTVKRVKITINYVKETQSEDFTYTGVLLDALLDIANKEISGYDIPADTTQTTDIVYHLVDFSEGKKYISARFVNDRYTAGAAHHNHSWFSVVYSRDEKRVLWLKDIFQLNNHNDSLKFIQIVGRNLDDHALELQTPFDSVDVFVRNDNEFLLGPQLSWADGLQTATLNVDSLFNFFARRWE